ncbi:MAG: YbaN family protein [Bacilli bacterium]|nr:YbaN family protein [Bacilli bacterium]
MRILFLIVGFISLALGTVGIFLPVIPTVPFYLLTAFCFVRGSERFAKWFLNSKLYKNHVGNFAKHRVMTLYGELILLLVVSAMLMTSLWFINKLAMSIVFTVLIACKYGYFVFRVTPVSRKEYLAIKEKDALEEKEKEEREL